MNLYSSVLKLLSVFLMSLSLVSITSLAMEKESVTSGFNNDLEIKPFPNELGLKIFTCGTGFGENKYRYETIFNNLFAAAICDSTIEHLFIPKFGKIKVDKFLDILFKAYSSFAQDRINPPKLTLIAVDNETFKTFDTKAKKYFEDNPSFGKDNLTYGQCNIKDIIYSLSISNGLPKEKGAIFMPGKGTLTGVMTTALNGINPCPEKINLMELTDPNKIDNTDGGYVGSKKAPSLTLTIAKLLKQAKGELHECPIVELTNLGLVITNSERIHDNYKVYFSQFSFHRSIKVPFNSIMDSLDKIGFFNSQDAKSPEQKQNVIVKLIVASNAFQTDYAQYEAISAIIAKSLPDPVTGEGLCDPMLAPSGYTYEKEIIEGWLKNKNVDPMTGTQLYVNDLRNNHVLKEIFNAKTLEEGITGALAYLEYNGKNFALQNYLMARKENPNIADNLKTKIVDTLRNLSKSPEIETNRLTINERW